MWAAAAGERRGMRLGGVSSLRLGAWRLLRLSSMVGVGSHSRQDWRIRRCGGAAWDAAAGMRRRAAAGMRRRAASDAELGLGLEREWTGFERRRRVRRQWSGGGFGGGGAAVERWRRAELGLGFQREVNAAGAAEEGGEGRWGILSSGRDVVSGPPVTGSSLGGRGQRLGTENLVWRMDP